MFRKASLLLIAMGVSACTTQLDTRVDGYRTAKADEFVKGLPYSLPMLQFDLQFTWTLSSCEKTGTLADEGTATPITIPGVGLTLAITEKKRYVPGERYTVDYDTLTARTKTTSFAFETYPNGILKSINAAADDKTDETLSAAVKLALVVYGASQGAVAVPVANSNPPSPSPTTPMSTGPLQTEAASSGLLFKKLPAVVCTEKARSDLRDLEALAGNLKTATKKVDAQRRLVEDLRMVVAQDAASVAHVEEFAAALKALSAQEGNSKSLVAQMEEITKRLRVSQRKTWPTDMKSSTDGNTTVDLKERDVEAFARLLTVAESTIIDKQSYDSAGESLLGYMYGLEVKPRSEFESANKDVLDLFLDELGRPRTLDVAKGCVAGPDGSGANADDCIRNMTGLRLSLAPTERLCERDKADTYCMLALATDDEGEHRTVGRDGAAAGVLWRRPAEAILAICNPDETAPEVSKKCPIVHASQAIAPQLGQLRLLEFRNRAFESGQLALALREDGTLERFSYSKAASAGKAAGAALNAAEKVEAYRDERDSAPLKALQDQIALKKSLLEDIGLDQAMARADTNAQVQMLQAEIALLMAELTRLKAERDLAAARQP
jgi:hypothetical protein